MGDFKKASTLHDDYGKKPNKRHPRTPLSRKSKTRKCEHHDNGICEPSKEALRLGLAKNLFLCNGNIPPDCPIRQKIADDMTIIEIYQK